MTEKNIEVELRGPLNDADHRAILAVLNAKGKLLKAQKRFLLDYSTESVSERDRDVRVRVTDGRVEVVVKKGKFGGTSREEASLFPEGNNLVSTLKLMSLLGYTKAVACVRAIRRYLIDGIEFAIQDVEMVNNPDVIHSRFFEAEIMSDEANKDAAIASIRAFLATHHLKEFTEDEWHSYVATIDKEANGVFTYSAENAEKIKHLGQAV